MKKLEIIKNIIVGVVIIECIILAFMITNRIIDLDNKVEKMQTRITQIEKGN